MSARHQIFVIDDDPAVTATLRDCLELEGYACRTAPDPCHPVAAVRRHPPDLILLDRVLPGTSGDEILRQLKSDPRTAGIPVVFLTAKSDETDELVGLSLGADDYVTKPFSPKRLVARIAAQLRSRAPATEIGERLPARSLMLDRTQPRVVIDEQPVPLSGVEYRLLAALIAARGLVLDDRQLGRMITAGRDDDRPLDLAAAIDELRRKMGPAAGCIQAVAERRYAFCYPAGQRRPA